MRRIGAVGLVAFGLALGSFGQGQSRGQTPGDLEATARFTANFQNPDGGFAPKAGAGSTLGATSSAVRILGYTAGSIRDVPGAIRYVKSCFDATTGGFAPEPGAIPTITDTTSGLAALAALKLDPKPYAAKAISFFEANAKTYEEVRIAIAGCDMIQATSPAFPRWTEIMNANRNADGSYGTGAAAPRATGGSAAALLRMGVPIEPAPKAAILATLRAGQKADGAWGEGDGASDLPTTYRIMRAFFMMKEKPDLARLRAFIARHRQTDGGYATLPAGIPEMSTTYFCTIINYWARQLDGEPVCVETAGFSPLFNGKDLAGWEGDTSLWAAQDGMIVGNSAGIKQNQFLATEATYADFVLKFSVRLVGDVGNSGVQLRSVRVPGTEMSGYQADVGPGYWGGLYDESRRNRELAACNPKALAGLHKGDWNQVTVRAMGNHITIYLNDQTAVDYREEDAQIPRDGKIALQVHAGGAMRVEFKDIYLQQLPTPSPRRPSGRPCRVSTSRA